jgi:2'-5' RNA ligase
MGADSKGAPSGVPARQYLNVFALVIYIPDPLGRFLDQLRTQLVPGSNPHAHVSVLPPRPLAVEWPVAGARVRSLAADWAPFDIGLAGIQVFPVTNVIYIELGTGASELHRMHAASNSGVLEFAEPFEYHPHITLAQEIPPGDFAEVNRTARRLWSEFQGPRVFRADRAALVQNAVGACWIDLDQYWLGEG